MPILEKYQSVSEVVSQIKYSIESEFRHVQIVGEVTNFTRSASGHYYFSLTDSESSLSCSLFKTDALRCPQIKKIKNGDQVICSGSIGVYAKRGSVQLVAKRVSAYGEGNLQAELDKLREKLSKEGLFDSSHKKKIPAFPKKIGLITSERGAAVQDFIKIIERRTLWSDVLLSPSLMQGSTAPAAIIHSLRQLIRYHLQNNDSLDVIVITRGGGSLEDLWCFNDEALAWEIYNCPIPVISAVGHEIDYTICDLVADWRSETPSAAAELLSESQVGLSERLERAEQSLKRVAEQFNEDIEQIKQRTNPRYWGSLISHQFSQARLKLQELNITGRAYELIDYYNMLMRVEEFFNTLNQFPRQFNEREQRLEEINGLLRALNPDNVLKRGYSYIKARERVVTSSHLLDELPEGTDLEITFHDGISKVRKS